MIDDCFCVKGLYMMLDAACQSDCTVLDPHLDNLLGNLFPQICTVVDYNNPQTVKNHNELLRCFAVLSKFLKKVPRHGFSVAQGYLNYLHFRGVYHRNI